MSTSPNKLKYLWSAVFEDNTILMQPEDDRYSKHVDGADYNPSAFRDVLEYMEKSPLQLFALGHSTELDYCVDLVNGEFGVFDIVTNGWKTFSLEEERLHDRKVIFFRSMHKDSDIKVTIDDNLNPQSETIRTSEPYVYQYIIGYEGKTARGKVIKKVIYIDG